MDSADAKLAVLTATLDHAVTTDDFKTHDWTDADLHRVGIIVAEYVTRKFPYASHFYQQVLAEGMVFGAMAWSMTELAQP